VSQQRCSPEFKDEAIRQVIERGRSLQEVAARLGLSWIHQPLSGRAMEDERLLELIRESYAASAVKFQIQPDQLVIRRMQEDQGDLNVSSASSLLTATT
jgi:hypothetical protein